MSTIGRPWSEDRTRTNAVLDSPVESPTRTTQDELAERAGHLRGATRFLLDDVADVHDEAIDIQMEARTDEAAKRSVADLLNELAELGFAWRDIARLVGVTVPAVRKWRQGEAATGAHRRAVARLLAFVDVLRSEHLVNEVSSWMEIPLAGSRRTGVDLYCDGHEKQLLLHAAGHLSSEELLDCVEPDWRDQLDDRFEIATASDGDPFIRLRSEPG